MTHLTALPFPLSQLARPEIYPHQVSRVELVQTHISLIFFAGNFVYKWKKPVKLGFLDFSTLSARHHFCLEEVRLNRRLCPDIYLSVVALTRQGEMYQLDGGGDAVEYGVKMRRLPAEKMMGRLIRDKGLKPQHLEGIIQRLVPFYQAAEVLTDPDGYGGHGAVARTVRENFDETRHFVGGEELGEKDFNRILEYAESFLDDRRPFDERVAAGRVRDCHGDLHSGNICLDEQIAIFDCLEFNRRLRCTDIAADVAFLAMDLDYYGLGQLSEDFVDRFIEVSGDNGLRGVLNFYKCYRAYVRGKIGLLTSADAWVDKETASEAARNARVYFQLALGYAEK